MQQDLIPLSLGSAHSVTHFRCVDGVLVVVDRCGCDGYAFGFGHWYSVVVVVVGNCVVVLGICVVVVAGICVVVVGD